MKEGRIINRYSDHRDSGRNAASRVGEGTRNGTENQLCQYHKANRTG